MFAPMANSRITCICGAIYEVINWRTGGQRNGNYRHGARSKEMIELWKLIKSLR